MSATEGRDARTEVSVDGTRILVDGRPTYPGSRAEGGLFNIRTVNATFDDTLGEVSWWDDDGSHPENDRAGYGTWRSPRSAFDNTRRFVEALPEYRGRGVLAVNLNFQGGHPLLARPEIPEGRGSANSRPNGHRDFYHNSAFRPDGTIDEDYARRIASVIEACDELGMVVILQLFYFGQDTVFEDETGIRSAVDHAVDFVCRRPSMNSGRRPEPVEGRRGYRNVIVEIANEVSKGHYHHEILKPARVEELVVRARERAAAEHGAGLLVSTSEAGLLRWTGEEIDRVFAACDVVLLHGADGVDHGDPADRTEVARKIDLVRSRAWYVERPRPIVFNESDGRLAFEAALERGASFGLHSSPYFQTMYPPRWGVWKNDTLWFFDRVKELTGV